MVAGMADAEQGGRIVAHPRASWLCPETGRALPQGELMRAMARKRAVLLGETHDIAEIHRDFGRARAAQGTVYRIAKFPMRVEIETPGELNPGLTLQGADVGVHFLPLNNRSTYNCAGTNPPPSIHALRPRRSGPRVDC